MGEVNNLAFLQEGSFSTSDDDSAVLFKHTEEESLESSTSSSASFSFLMAAFISCVVGLGAWDMLMAAADSLLWREEKEGLGSGATISSTLYSPQESPRHSAKQASVT